MGLLIDDGPAPDDLEVGYPVDCLICWARRHYPETAKKYYINAHGEGGYRCSPRCPDWD